MSHETIFMSPAVSIARLLRASFPQMHKEKFQAEVGPALLVPLGGWHGPDGRGIAQSPAAAVSLPSWCGRRWLPAAAAQDAARRGA